MPPQGVRLRLLDGTAIECDLVCDPESSRDGMVQWFAVPRETLLSAPPAGIECDLLPARTSLVLDAAFSRRET